MTANGENLKISDMHDSKVSFINLSNVLHFPKLATNLVSVGQLVDDVNSGRNHWEDDREGPQSWLVLCNEV